VETRAVPRDRVLVHAMTSVAVVTSIYGSYDSLNDQPAQSVPCEFVAVVDAPQPSGTWGVVVEPRPHMHPRLAAKVAKCLPWRYAPEVDVTIWIDGSATIISPDFVEMCLDCLDGELMAQWEHPERGCIYTEAAVSEMFGKYAGQNLTGQATHYKSKGHPDGWGLWATGCIVRQHDRHLHTLMGTLWLAEQMRWTYQDQISEPPVLRACDVRPAPLPEGLWSNRWLSFGAHLGGDA
jgi:hypothetical protein